ncbi:NAD(P)-dependent oxidoreductase [Pyruvatibacter sp.]|uniref:NAD-dependent epimerase/dehydratase family protein n=1 Tax=Pyruvatibacter sp. TaxID=1981328 RepID=UPI0032F037B7
MKVLVTGGGGFVGAPTVHSLRALGHDVASHPHAMFNILDSYDRAQLIKKSQADVLVHLAWQTTHGHFWTAPDNAAWRDASNDLLTRFFDAGGKRAVMAGSCAEYDWTAQADPLPETAPCTPATFYGRCKLDTLRHAEQMMQAGASIAWGRLFFLMGPNETATRFIPSIIRPLLAGDTARMGPGTGLRDFLHTADAGAAFAALAGSAATGAINIASGTSLSLAEVALQTKSLIATGTLSIGALPARAGEPHALVADVTRLRDEVGFKPRHTLISALEDCIDYWRRQVDR